MNTGSTSKPKKSAGKKRHLPDHAENWETFSDEQLLALRIRDLKLKIEDSPLKPRIDRLYHELTTKGITFKPPCYLADEWLCPDRIPIIGIPFYLAHPRLTQLERTIMLEAEGGDETWCMKLLRHEAGHAINYAYRLYRRSRWRELFGSFSKPYTMGYSAQPYSKKFVIHLEDNYAQAHPDEDFAESFAVWLAPDEHWEEDYEGWPVIKKLRYIDRIMATIGPQQPLVTQIQTPWSASRMTSTLEAFYHRKRLYLGEEFPGYFDPALSRVFTTPSDTHSPHRASSFLKRHRKKIVASVSMWTRQRKFDIDKLLRKLTLRCAELDLRIDRPEPDVLCEITSLTAAVMCNTRRVRSVIEGS